MTLSSLEQVQELGWIIQPISTIITLVW